MGEYFDEKDIAMIEHEAITEQEFLDWKPEDMQWYLSGLHEMAMKIIAKINEKEGDV